MKKYAVSSLALLVIIALFSGTALAQAGISHRINDQQRRIVHGAKSGVLTPREVSILRDNLNHIKHRYNRAKADGRLSRHEIRRLNQMLDRNARMIRKLRGNRIIRLY